MKSLWHPGYQPPPYSHNLTTAWPVMLIANQRLPDGNQIFARIMSLSKSILGKRKFLSTFRWRFVKKIFKCFFLWWNTARRSCRTFILQLQIIKNLLVKVRWLRSVPKAGKKSRWSTIFHELESVVKTKIAQNNSQVSEGGITVKPGQDSSSIHELIIWKENPFVASVTCGWYQIAFKW